MILALMPFTPAPEGTGGMQRAWQLLQGLAAVQPVHLVLLQQPAYHREPDLAALNAIAASVTQIPIPTWDPLSRRIKGLPRRIGQWFDLARIGTTHAPRLDRKTLDMIARALPIRDVETLFAGRLACAAVVDQLIATGALKAKRKLVDFDDIQSRFLAREASAMHGLLKTDKRLFAHMEQARVTQAEATCAAGWDAISVCSQDDLAVLRRTYPGARVSILPNVLDRPLLPPARKDAFTLLFVGNLGFGPNLHGLDSFVRDGWPRLRAARPELRFQVVGLNPPAGLPARLADAGIELHANVPSVEPFYAGADAVIAPILFGGGTRIKILEAMAYGRPVVSTTIGAEGLDIEPGHHAMIADDMAGLADAVVALAHDPQRGAVMAEAARCHQQARFGPRALVAAVQEMATPQAMPGNGAIA